jgi:hypothetical protein
MLFGPKLSMYAQDIICVGGVRQKVIYLCLCCACRIEVLLRWA